MKQYNTQSTNKQTTKRILLLQRHTIHILLGADHQQRTKWTTKIMSKVFTKWISKVSHSDGYLWAPQMGLVARLKTIQQLFLIIRIPLWSKSAQLSSKHQPGPGTPAEQGSLSPKALHTKIQPTTGRDWDNTQLQSAGDPALAGHWGTGGARCAA